MRAEPCAGVSALVSAQSMYHEEHVKKLPLIAAVFTALMAHAQLATKKALTLEAAKEIAAAAEAEAKKNNWTMVISIVDDGGHLIYLERMDGTQIGSVEVAQEKAATAIKFKRPTKSLEDNVAGGRQVILKLPGATPIEGGLPIAVGNEIIGAIGVSGGTSPQDGQVAAAGLAAVSKMK
jgi:glc operon protein GlcG